MAQSNPFDQFDGPQPRGRQGQVFALPRDPLEAAKKRADLTNAELMAQSRKATAPYDARKAAAEAAKAEAEARLANQKAAQGAPTKDLSPEVRAKALAQFQSAAQIEQAIAELRQLGQKGPLATTGLIGLTDYLPLEANSNFNAAGQSLRGIVRNALGLTGGENNTAAEAKMNIGAYIPSAGDYNSVIEQKLKRLQELANGARSTAVRTLGGVPDANGNIRPLQPRQQQSGAAPAQKRDDRAPMIGALPGGASGGGGDYRGGPLPTGPTRQKYDAQLSAMAESLLRRGATADQINAALEASGASPKSRVTEEMLKGARNTLSRSPTYSGRLITVSREEALSPQQRATNDLFNSPAGPVAAGVVGLLNAPKKLVDGVTLGATKSQEYDDNLAALGRSGTGNAIGLGVGNLLGDFGLFAAGGLGAARLGAAVPGIAGRAIANPLTADAVLGGALGAGNAPQGQEGVGALTGAALGGGGGFLGRRVGEKIIGPGINAVLGKLGVAGAAPALNSGERTLLGTLNRTPDYADRLLEAQQLGVPMTLADAGVPLQSLGGAVARRSPQAGQLARDVYQPRARGQYDRFVGTVERDLGPVRNVPEVMDQLTRQAREAAAPLYDRAYQAPVLATEEMQSLLNTPFGRQAAARANTIAANERRAPQELGMVMDDAGNPVLNPQPFDAMAAHLNARAEVEAAQEAYRVARQTPGANADAARDQLLAARARETVARRAVEAAPDPNAAASVPGFTTQSLDYIKRGMDDVLEQYRNPLTNRLQLDEAGRAQLDVKNRLLSEVDTLNPDFAAARRAYAGPVSDRDAIGRGYEYYKADPRQIAMQVPNETPGQLPLTQLGFRDAMVKDAGALRTTSNPYAAIDRPQVAQRINAMFPNNPNVDRFMRTGQLERELADSQNRMLGNSATAERLIADENFAGGMGGDLAEGALSIATGAPPMGAIRRLLSTKIADMAKLGMGKAAERRANQLAPILYNTDTGKTLEEVARLLVSSQRYNDAIRRFGNPRAVGDIFGSIPLALSAQQ